MTHHELRTDEGGDPTAQLLAEAGFVQRLARSLVRDATTADDVAQETMAAGLAQPVAPRSWRDWLATVARRHAGKARAARRVREAHEAAAARGRDGGAAGDTARRLELQQQLTAAVAALAEPYRTVVTLRYFDGLTPRAIAKRSGATASAVRQQLHRGLAMLRRRLDGECGGRQRWLAAFAAAGLGGVTVSLVPLAVLAMNKLYVAAAAVLVAGGVFWMVADPSAQPQPVAPDAGGAAGVVADSSVAPRSSPNAPEQRIDVAPTASTCVVAVRDAAGQPLAGAEVKFWRPDDTVVDATTDARGEAIAPTGDVAGALVRSPDCVPAWQPLHEGQRHVDVRLATAAVVGGTLLVDEQPAPPGTQLRFVVAGWHEIDGVPAALRDALDFHGSDRFETREHGAFVLRGLPLGAQTYLDLPRHLMPLPYTDDGWRLELPIGRTDHVIRTTLLPTIEGKVVWDDDDTPVAGAHLIAYARFDDGSNTPSTGKGADERGYFVIGLLSSRPNRIASWADPAQRPAVTNVEVRAEFDGCDGEAVLNVDRDQYLAGPVTLRLRRAPVRHFLALDVQGVPIEGAIVATRDLSEPSDAQGRGTFRGQPADVKLVGSPSHRIGPLAPRDQATGTLDDPLVFVLPPDNEVRIVVHDDHGGRPDVHAILVHATPSPFAGQRMAGALDQQLHGFDRQSQGARNRVHYYCYLDVPADGSPTRLRSLEPGAVLRVEVVDRLGSVLAHDTITAPPFGEQAEKTLAVTSRSHALDGVVRGADGMPLAHAKVELRGRADDGEWLSRNGGHLPWLHAATDDQGRFRFGPLHVGVPCRLSVTAAGYTALHLEVPADQLWQPLDMQLTKGHTVTVRVVDEAGADVPLIAFIRDSEFDNQQTGPNTTRFADLPAGPIQFSVQVGGVYLSTTHDTRSADAVLRVPHLGKLAVQCNNGWPSLPDGHYFEANIKRLDADDPPFTIWTPERPGCPPELLLPGRYRVELIEVGDGRKPFGLAAEVVVEAGQTATATLR